MPSIIKTIKFRRQDLLSFVEEKIVFVVFKNTWPQDKHLNLWFPLRLPYFIKSTLSQKGQQKVFKSIKKSFFLKRKQPSTKGTTLIKPILMAAYVRFISDNYYMRKKGWLQNHKITNLFVNTSIKILNFSLYVRIRTHKKRPWYIVSAVFFLYV